MSSSPFELFRRNLKPLMVLLTLLALFSFVVLPSVAMYQQRAAGMSGTDTKLASYDGGTFEAGKVSYFTRSHFLTLQFLRQLADITISRGGSPRVSNFQYNEQQQQIVSLGINDNPSDQASVRTMMFATEAKKAGLDLDDTAIRTWLNAFTDGRLSDAEINGVLQQSTRSQLGQFQLYEQLRTQLLSETFQRKAMSGLAVEGRPIVPPAQQWELFLRLNRNAVADAVAVNVADFVAKTSDKPTGDAINRMYEEGKERFPDERSSDPAFRRPYVADFEYLTGFLEEFIEREVATISEETLRAEYERRLAGGDFQMPQLPDDAPLGDEPTDDEPPMQTEPGEPADADAPALNAPADPAEPAATPAPAEPAAPAETPAEPATPAETPAEPETPADSPAEPATPAEPETPAESPVEPESPAEPEAPAEPESPQPAVEDSSSVVAGFATRLVIARAQEPADEPAPAEPAAPADEPATPADEPAAPADEPAAPADEPAAPADEPATPADEPAAPADEPATPADEPAAPAETPAPADTPAEPAPATPDAPSDPAEPAEPTEPATPAEPKNRPFEDVRDEIARQLALPPASEKLDQAITEVDRVMRSYFNARAIAGTDESKIPPRPNLAELAESLGMTYTKTGLIDARQLQDQTILRSFGVGTGMQRGNSFLQTMYIDQPPLFAPLRTVDDQGGMSFVSWKTEERAASIPTLEEANDEVVAAIRLAEARKLARAEADKMAAEFNKSAKPLRELVPESQSAQLFEALGPFSWMTSFGFGMQATMGEVPELDNVGEAFMRQVFNGEREKWGVAPNAPETVFYVVRPTEFSPSTEELYSRFTQLLQRFQANSLAVEEAIRLRDGYYEAVDKRVGFKWNESALP